MEIGGHRYGKINLSQHPGKGSLRIPEIDWDGVYIVLLGENLFHGRHEYCCNPGECF